MKKELITAKRLYTSRLEGRRVINKEGWIRYEKFPPYKPTGIEEIDRLAALFQRRCNLSLKRAAEELQLSTPYLREIVLYHTGKQYMELRYEYQLLIVTELLACTDLPLSEIAARSGYCSREALSTVFKKRTNITMREYRWRKRPENFRELYKW